MQARIFGLESAAAESPDGNVRVTIINRKADRVGLSLDLTRDELEILAGLTTPAELRRAS
ncbi:MAG: hypothetical protein RQ752_12675 [Thermohalobaculum sp.]|nr:hypothetical protein [Thermohalobaculum sp.]